MADRNQRIRERAHALWEQEGRPDGRADEHWRRAVSEIGSNDEFAGADTGSFAGESGARRADASQPIGGDAGNGLSTNLQPGGTIPGASPAVGAGSIGTGGGSTANAPTGTAARGY